MTRFSAQSGKTRLDNHYTMLTESGIIIRNYTKISATRGETGEWRMNRLLVIACGVLIHNSDFRIV